MNIYLACTVRGDRHGLNAARAIAELLARMGHIVLTPHLLADDVDAAEAVLRRGLSRLITGNSHAACTTYGYGDTTDLLRFVERVLSDAEPRDVNLPC